MQDDYTDLLNRSHASVWQLINVCCILSSVGLGAVLLHGIQDSTRHTPVNGHFIAVVLMLASVSFAAKLWYSSRFFFPIEHFAKFRWRTAAGAVGRVVRISGGGSHLLLKFPTGVTQTYALRQLVREEEIR
jgi:hypothetical protein